MSTRAFLGLGPAADDKIFEDANAIQAYLACHPVVARILFSRGLRGQKQLDQFLKPELSQLPNPYSIIDMERAVERVVEALANEEKIAVYGDYDVDGTCGSTILVEFLRELGAEPVHYQPNRFTEGYGVNVPAVEKLITEGARLILTVDCGITAVDPARVCREKGIDFIVIDHHKVGDELPEAFAIVDPQREDDTSGLLNVCGAGLAFFFIIALRSALREVDYFEPPRTEPNLLKYLDLAAIATVADVMDLRGVNRILVTHGLRVMNSKPRPGIRALLDVAKVENVTAMHCGFILGPRINAAGRLKSAKAAYELLTAKDPEQARVFAQDLDQLNSARREKQDEVYLEARVQAMEQMLSPQLAQLSRELPSAELAPWPRALVLAPRHDQEWHEGVLGIVASKLVEEFFRPVFVLSRKEGAQESVLKGSIRSIPKIDIISVLSQNEAISDLLLNYGGHAHAGGMSIEESKFEKFIVELNRALAVSTDHATYTRERHFDAEVDISEIDARLVGEIHSLAPFGQGFPEPVFKIRDARIEQATILKEKHLKMRLERGLDALWFNSPMIETLTAAKSASFWVTPQWNEWRGVKRLQLQVKHAESYGKP